jgi:NADH:ubiquinone oxidoreductase subunit 3 (subunit A)
MIIETFFVNRSYNEYIDKVEDKKNTYNDSFFDYCGEMCSPDKRSSYLIIAILLSVVTSIVAGILAWRCNAKEHIIYRLINTIISILFSDIYVLYYVIYRVILKNKCY